MTGESVLLAKVTIEYLSNTQDERLDALLPEVTRHVFNLEHYYNLYQDSLDAGEPTDHYEFILDQLLDISLGLDYADEMGRRKMFEFTRNIMRSYTFSDAHLAKIVKLFRLISIDEKDFTRSIIEIISDIQDGVTDRVDLETDKPLKKMKLDDGSSQSVQRDETDTQLRCLKICKMMLENSFEVSTCNI